MNSVYDMYHVKKVINASGKMTILGGSRVHERVLEGMRLGGQNFFEIKDLLDKTGEALAQKLNVESAYIVNSASGGIAQCIAACICKDNLYNILHLSTCDAKRQIVMPKGHNVDYGTPIEVTISLGGGIIKEAGYANGCSKEQLEACIDEHTAALVYVKSHHCVQKGILSIQEMVELKEKYHLPLIIDAAAEEDLTRYANMGADAVIYSGTKALEGPASGLIVGKKAFLDLVKLQSKGIGRVMKIGKENILGLCAAIEYYLTKPHQSMDEQKLRLKEFHEHMNAISGIKARCVQDGAGREIIRSELSFHNCKYSALEIKDLLKKGDIAIYTRDYRANEGIIEIDIRDVSDEELKIIENKIIAIVKEGKTL